jgi:protein-disulfide isomerase
MKAPLFILILSGTLAAGCSPKSDAPTAHSAAQPAEAPAAPESAPLPPDLAARLIRPHSPILGPANAPVTIVEFLDPACEACRAYAPVVKQVMFLHPDDVRVVVRYAAFHRGSDEAIRILDAARQQGKFDEVLSALFDAQPDWASHGSPDLERAWKAAGAAGLDLARARRDAKYPSADQALKIDDEDINALAVESTPTFFVNGVRLVSHGADPLLKRVAEEVARSKSAPQGS